MFIFSSLDCVSCDESGMGYRRRALVGVGQALEPCLPLWFERSDVDAVIDLQGASDSTSELLQRVLDVIHEPSSPHRAASAARPASPPARRPRPSARLGSHLARACS